MCEPAIHVLRSVFMRLVRQNEFASVATLRVLFFLRIRERLRSERKGESESRSLQERFYLTRSLIGYRSAEGEERKNMYETCTRYLPSPCVL